MSLHHTSTPARLRKTAVVGALAALTATIAIAPAHAAEPGIVEVGTGEEYVVAVNDASTSDSATTIMLTADISIPAGEDPTYEGTQDLTVDGAGYTVSPSASGENSSFLRIYADDAAHVTVTDITVQHFDTASRVIDADSGASLTVTNSRFVDNGTPGQSSRAVRTDIPTVISGSEFSGNRSSSYGTAIDGSAPLVIENSTIAGNVSTGTVIEHYGDLKISGSTIAQNSAPGDAVIYSSGNYAVEVENSTFVDNESYTGPLTLGGDNTKVVSHSTFANNSGTGESYGAHLTLWTDATLTGNVFTGAVDSVGCDLNDTLTTSYNFDADGTCTNEWAGEGDIGDGVDPLLGELASNGGPTQTLLPLEGSPLIDVVPAGVTDLTVDQRGEARPSGDAADIGAVEVQPIVEDDEDDDTGVPGDEGGTGDGDTGSGSVAFQVKTDGGVLYGTASGAVSVTDINWTATGDLTGAPADTALPYGAAGFTVEVPEPGASVTVTLTAPAPFTSAYKVSGATWTAIPGATFSADGTTVTYTLTDGGELDEDGEANGYIVDPVALAVQATFTG